MRADTVCHCLCIGPSGGFTEKHEVHELTANIDLLPTLIDLCDLEVSSNAHFHGTSIAPLLRNEAEDMGRTGDRHRFAAR